jgi:hypothetical protein
MASAACCRHQLFELASCGDCQPDVMQMGSQSRASTQLTGARGCVLRPSTPTYEPRTRQKPRTRLTPQRQWQTTSTSPDFLPRGTPSLVQNGYAVKYAVRRRSRRSGPAIGLPVLDVINFSHCRFSRLSRCCEHYLSDHAGLLILQTRSGRIWFLSSQ